MKHDLTELNAFNCDLKFYQDNLYREYLCQSLDDLIARMSDKIEELRGELRDMSDAEKNARNELTEAKDEISNLKDNLAEAMSTINKLEAEIQVLKKYEIQA